MLVSVQNFRLQSVVGFALLVGSSAIAADESYIVYQHAAPPTGVVAPMSGHLQYTGGLGRVNTVSPAGGFYHQAPAPVYVNGCSWCQPYTVPVRQNSLVPQGFAGYAIVPGPRPQTVQHSMPQVIIRHGQNSTSSSPIVGIGNLSSEIRPIVNGPMVSGNSYPLVQSTRLRSSVPPVPAVIDDGASISSPETVPAKPEVGVPQAVDVTNAQPAVEKTIDLTIKAEHPKPETQEVEETVAQEMEPPSDQTTKSVDEEPADTVVTKPAAPVEESSPAKRSTKRMGESKTAARTARKVKNKKTIQVAGKKREEHVKKLSPLLAWNPAGLNLPDNMDCGGSSEIVSHKSIRIDNHNSLDLRHGWVSFPDADKRVYEDITKAQKFSIIASVMCENEKQKGPARIVSNSKDSGDRNFTLGQDGKKFVIRIRTSKDDDNGSKHETSFGHVKPGTRQDIAVTYDGRRLICFVDGKQVEDRKFKVDFKSWKKFPVSAGNEATGERDWSGRIYSLAVLSSADVEQVKQLMKNDRDKD